MVKSGHKCAYAVMTYRKAECYIKWFYNREQFVFIKDSYYELLMSVKWVLGEGIGIFFVYSCMVNWVSGKHRAKYDVDGISVIYMYLYIYFCNNYFGEKIMNEYIWLLKGSALLNKPRCYPLNSNIAVWYTNLYDQLSHHDRNTKAHFNNTYNEIQLEGVISWEIRWWLMSRFIEYLYVLTFITYTLRPVDVWCWGTRCSFHYIHGDQLECQLYRNVIDCNHD